MRVSQAVGYVFTMAAASTAASQNLLENGSFESGTDSWVSVGDVSVSSEAWDGAFAVRLNPEPKQTAELSQ